MSPTSKTLVDLLLSRAETAPSRGIWFVESDVDETWCSYADLLTRAESIAAGLEALGLRAGDKAPLVFRRPSQFLPMFWGCLLAGIVPVPLAPPMRAEDSDELRKLSAIWQLLGHPRVLVESSFARAMDGLLDPSGKVHPAIGFDEIPKDLSRRSGHHPAPSDLAFIQYSSGSTRAPRGVMLSHANLVANVGQIAGRIPLDPPDVELGWMPHFHDMGLIGCHLTPLAQGAVQVRMETSVFLREPDRWLTVATAKRATILTATNTALRLLLRRVTDARDRGWDLRSVQALLVGAEPISPRVLREVAQLLAPAGLAASALRVSYGLAEACVAVSFPGPQPAAPSWRLSQSALSERRVVEQPPERQDDVVEVAESGWPVEGVSLRIVDDEDCPVADRVVGHIQFQGPNASPGYYEDEASTAASRCGAWWRTGDLGFVDNGHLAVCGRVKELLFFGGKNVFAQDIEAAAMGEPGVHTAVACTAPSKDGTHEFTLLFVVARAGRWQDDPMVLDRVRRRVLRELHAPMDAVIPVAREEIPRTSSGKIRRFRLAEKFAHGHYDGVLDEVRVSRAKASGGLTPQAGGEGNKPDTWLSLVVRTWSAVLGVSERAIGAADRFDELGGTSVGAQEILSRLEEATGQKLGQAMLSACPTAEQMAEWLRHPPVEAGRASSRATAPRRSAGREIAIIAAACRFPGASTPGEFWDQLARGVDSIGVIPQGRWPEATLAGIRCKTGAFLDDPYAFDAGYFGIGTEEATGMDPQQRLLLGIGAECMQTAGYGGARRRGLRTGVYVGASQLPYQEQWTASWHRAEALETLASTAAFSRLPEEARRQLRAAFNEIAPQRPVHPSTLVGNLLNMLAARLSHELDLDGPAMALDTACSASLVAVHEACESLLRGECDLALAGGVSLNLTPSLYRFFEAAGALSPTGRSHPFGVDGDGFVPGEGAALVLLRPLSDAVAAGDRILAVIKGSAVNNDGRSIGVMAPNPEGQRSVLAAAYANAGVDPASVDLVECHGTGTKIGDPIELRTVAEFFGGRGDRSLRIGSVKSNMGHLLGAAGIAGLLKVVLALSRGAFPPSLHADPPHPRLAERPMLRVPASLEPWDIPAQGQRLAGVNSFGFGGTNCHVVVQGWQLAPPNAVAHVDVPAHLAVLSAPSDAHLEAWAHRLAGESTTVDAEPQATASELLAAIPHAGVRAIRVVTKAESLSRTFGELGRGAEAGWRRRTTRGPGNAPRVAWLFPGQGSQFVGAARGLLDHWERFRARAQELAARVSIGRPLLDYCYADDADDDALRRTDVAQPLLVVFQIAMVDALRDLGLEPAAVLGHSVGEFAAAYAAGGLQAETAVDWAASRGRLMQELQGDGAMAAVLAEPSRFERSLARYSPAVVIAAYNGPSQTILSGERGAVDALIAELEAQDITVIRVPVRHAFHSPMVTPAAERFAKWMGDVQTSPLRIPFASTVRGTLIQSESLPASYWAEQVRKPVLFHSAMDALGGAGIDVWLEVGPGATLAGLAERILPRDKSAAVLSVCRRAGPADTDADWTHALSALGAMWLQGAPLERTPGPIEATRGRMQLPAQPYLPGSYRIEAPVTTPPVRSASSAQLRVRAWEPRPAPVSRGVSPGIWLVFTEDADTAPPMAAQLRSAGHRAVVVTTASTFGRSGEDLFELDTTLEAQIGWLIGSFGGDKPAGVLLIPATVRWDREGRTAVATAESLARSMRSIAAIASALEENAPGAVLAVLTTRAWAIGSDPSTADPCAAAIATYASAVFEEHPRVRGKQLDVIAIDPRAVVPELDANDGQSLLAMRGGTRLVPAWRDLAPSSPRTLPSSGVYVVLGGSSELAVELVEEIVARSGGRPAIILAGRTPESSLDRAPASLSGGKADVEYRVVDVTRADEVRAVIDGALERHGRVDGIIHAAGSAIAGSARGRSVDEVRAVLEPKVAGAIHIARALRGRPVGFVALQSSISASSPPLAKGLADYAAANAFLDAFAGALRTDAQPWVSIGWAPWTGVGMAKALGDAASPALGALARQTGRSSFLAVLSSGAAHVVVSSTGAAPPAAARTPSAGPIESSSPAQRPRVSPAIAPAVPPATPAVLPGDLEAVVRGLLASALRVEPGTIDRDTPFQAMGLGSLAAVDLLKELEALTGKKLGTTLLFEHNTLARVVGHLETEGESGYRAPVSTVPSRGSAPASRARRIPLLPAQQTFYANHAFQPELPGYVFLRLDLEGPVSEDRLDQALAVLVERHPMLRVVFDWEGDSLVQREGDFPVPLVERMDLTRERAASLPGRLAAVEDELRNRVFDLATGPLFRAVLARITPDRASLLFNIHHIVADAWSAQILVTELLVVHANLAAGRPAGLEPIDASFEQCVEQVLSSGPSADAEKSAAYWRETLRGAPDLPLPFDGDPLAMPSGPCHLHQIELDADTTARLQTVAREWAVSPFQLLFTSYLLALHKWSTQSDIVVRVANARREARIRDIQRVVGCFADSLPIRVQLRPGEPLRELARRVLDATVAAQNHPLTSSLQLAGIRGRPAQASPRGVTPAGLSFPDFQAPEHYGLVRVAAMRGGSASAFSQLGLIAWQFGGRLHLSWNFLHSLFRPETIRRLADEYVQLLRGLLTDSAAASPNTSRPASPSLSAGPTRRSRLPEGEVVHERILAQCEAAPDRVAVRFESASLTYGALRDRARRLSEALVEDGIGPGALVGILAPPGIDAVVGLLGILGSGGAYVPLSPDYPDARIAQIASHARLTHLVMTRDQVSRLAGMPSIALRRVWLVDDSDVAVPSGLDRPTMQGQRGEQRAATARDLAYVMYTSGTTGSPKGVMVTHGAVSLFHDWVHEAFEISREDRFIQTSSLGFGGSIRQVYSPLLAGATVLPAPRGLTRDPFALVSFLEDQRITIWNSVPTLWSRLLECVHQLDAEGRRTELAQLRWILIGGEHVPAANVRRWMDRFGHRHRIANLYGSTETVVNATWHEVDKRPSDDALHTPIGKARAGSRVHVLDEDGREVRRGEIGELHVGGPSLSSGYLHAADLTAAAFVVLPGEQSPAYRTGDLAREDERGDLVYLGRRDTQVKIRGNRVELGEIEGVLGLHPTVGAAAVVELTTDTRQWLVAFVTPAIAGTPPDVAALRAHVASVLPEFMVPHRIEVLPALPLTSAGKIDRRALLERLDAVRGDTDGDEPATDTERAIAQAWCAVLGLPRVGRDDDFFDLGGDSILALQVLQRLRKALPVAPRPMTMYAERTVRRLARAIESMELAPVAILPGTPRVRRETDLNPDTSWFPLSSSQESFVLAQRGSPDRSPLWSARVPVRGRCDPDALQAAADVAMQRHPMLRAELGKDGVATVQRVAPRTSAPLVFEDLRGLDEAKRLLETDARYQAERTSLFALDQWPLWRMRVLQVDDDAWELLLTVHHAIGDGWSVHVLGSELLRDYDAILEGRPVIADTQRTGFRDAVEYLRTAPNARLRASERVWAETFASPCPAATVLTGGGAAEGGQGSLVASAVSAELTESIRRMAMRRKVSLHTLLLTAWFRTIRRAASCSDLAIGVATSGRELPLDGIEGVFGCFAIGLPIRARVEGADFDADLRAVETSFRTATEHAELPIERLLRAIPRHDGAPHPPGRTFFFSLMDFRALPPIKSAHLSVGWSDAEYHFDAAATGTELMLGVLARDELRLNVHGAAPAQVRREVLDGFLTELRTLASQGAAQEPGLGAAMIDSAIIAYLPAPAALGGLGLSAEPEQAREALRQLLFPDGAPVLVETLTTRFGTSGTVLIPAFADELPHAGADAIARVVRSAVQVAGAHGARVVSLAGMLPSWTDYGVGVQRLGNESSQAANGGPRLTTGHAATSVAVATTLQAALRALGWRLEELSLGMVGFGSIGQTAIHLLLDAGQTPRSIAISELEARVDYLASPLQALRARFPGPIQVVPVSQGIPEALLACDVLIAATSEGNVIDVSSLRPGTVVVDDSFPPAIDSAAAVERMARDGDILVLRGGQLDLGEGSRRVTAGVSLTTVEEALRRIGLEGVPGCRAESMIGASEQQLPSIIGLVDRQQGSAWWEACERIGVGPAKLHCGPAPIAEEWIRRMKKQRAQVT